MTDDYQLLRQTRCLTASNAHTSCPTILAGLVNHDDYLAIGDAPPPATVTAAIADTDILSHFLNVGGIGVSGIDATGLTITLGDDRVPRPGILRRAGDALDGVTYVSGRIEDADQSFVALLPSTNLGVPLPSSTPNATWRGMFFSGISNRTADIDFVINFSTSKINAMDIQLEGATTTFTLDFTPAGVITGDVLLESSVNDDTAQVRGLIGEQGLVGGYANTDGGVWGGGLHGAFVAKNPLFDDEPLVVNTADWLDSFTGDKTLTTTPDATQAPVYRNQFLEITATTASTLTAELVPTTLFMTGSTTNGLAFFAENNAYYAGILDGTNLGAPITEIITTAVRWTGQIRSDGSHGALVLDENEITDFWLDITFDGNKGKIMNDLTSLDGTFYYQIKGTFDNKGVISGLVEFGHTTGTGDARALDADHALYTPGTLTGLIGRNSAVGAFINGHASINGGLVGVAYGGGFVVTPPAPTN